MRMITPRLGTRRPVLRPWVDRTVVLLGGGPSVTPALLQRLQEEKLWVVGINDSVIRAPWVPACFSVDFLWVRRRREFLRRKYFGEIHLALASSGMRRMQEWRGGRPDLRLYRLRYRHHLRANPGEVDFGLNSGAAALSLAVTLGASHILLAGYDLQEEGHWYPEYFWEGTYGVKEYPSWAKAYERVVKEADRLKVRVRNLNPESRITAFPSTSLEEELEYVRSHHG